MPAKTTSGRLIHGGTTTKATPERSGSARSTFERILAIAVELTTPQGANTPELARRFEVSTKSIQRDLDFMRDRLLLDIRYEQQGRCRGAWRRGNWHTSQVERVQGIKAVFANLSH
jgi:response regulator of citrate/malate metabolism